MVAEGLDEFVDRLRRFDRFYARRLRRVLRGISREDFSLVALRILHELSLAGGPRTNASLCWELDLDSGYLSRELRKLEGWGLVRAADSQVDGRSRDWTLTESGEYLARIVEREYRERALGTLLALREAERRLGVVQALLARTPSADLFDELRERRATKRTSWL